MERKCSNCINWTGQHGLDEYDYDASAMCRRMGVNTYAIGGCPACVTPDMSAGDIQAQNEHMQKERERLLSLTPSSPAPVPVVSKPQVKKSRRKQASPMLVTYNLSRPVMKPFGHQLTAFERYKDADVIPLFFEMGCGKTFTTLHIAEYKYKQGQIQGLLVVAPNDVHRQWYDDLVNGVDVNHDGVMWQELGIDFQAQCVGGNGGQKELYPFERDDMFKFVSVNVDTFSTPHKWEELVTWANSGKYMIAIDEATVIKNPSSKRSTRLLYEFNNIRKRGKAVVSSVKKFPIRAVLTGTPVTNGPMDLWSIMEFVQPNFFGRNYYSFRAYYGMFTKLTVQTSFGSAREVDVLLTEKTWRGIHACENYEEAYVMFGCSEDTYMTIKHQDKFIGPYKHADELKELLSKVAMFVKLTDCVDMPPVNYIERNVGMSVEQQAVYNSMKKDLLAKFDGYTATASNKLVVSTRLQQISSGFIMGHKALADIDWDVLSVDEAQAQLFIESKDLSPDEVVWLGETNPKLNALMRDVAECDKPLLIITRYSAEAAKIFELCEKEGYKVGLFTGWKVVGGTDAFKAGDLDILVANSSKICRGFNLQIAHTTLFYSNTFSMEIRQQTEFRTFRMGQKEPCLYIDYTSCDVDETINKALVMKKGLLEYIRDKKLEEII